MPNSTKPNHSDAGNTATRILDTAEALLRRHGIGKVNVVDVARVLGMSHGNVYRHFQSKAALRSAVVHRWLNRVSTQTAVIAKKNAPADERLVEWLRTLAEVKQRKVTEDAELLNAAVEVVRDCPEVQHEHAALLTDQVVRILTDGLADQTLPGVGDPAATASAILSATTRYHHPVMVANGGPAEEQMRGLNGVITLILSGIGVRSERTTSPVP